MQGKIKLGTCVLERVELAFIEEKITESCLHIVWPCEKKTNKDPIKKS